MEFLEHVIISLDGDGRTWIYDGGQRSLRSIEADGRMRAPTPARTISEGATASSLVPLDDGRFLTVWPTHGETLSRPGSLDMEILERPWKGLRDHESLVNQLRVERIGGDSLVWAHVLGGGFQFAGLGEAFEHWIPFVERTPIPEVIAEETTYNGRSATLRRIGADTRAALSIAVAEDVLYVLFEGKTRHARHLVDRYEIPSGRYLGTWMLEEPARAIAADGDLFASIEGDVIPKLVIRRIPPRAASERPEQP